MMHLNHDEIAARLENFLERAKLDSEATPADLETFRVFTGHLAALLDTMQGRSSGARFAMHMCAITLLTCADPKPATQAMCFVRDTLDAIAAGEFDNTDPELDAGEFEDAQREDLH